MRAVLTKEEKPVVGIAQQGRMTFAIAGHGDGLESVQRFPGRRAGHIVAIQPALRAQFERPGKPGEQKDRGERSGETQQVGRNVHRPRNQERARAESCSIAGRTGETS